MWMNVVLKYDFLVLVWVKIMQLKIKSVFFNINAKLRQHFYQKVTISVKKNH